MSEQIAATVNQYGLAGEAIVIASGTLQAAGIRQAADVDMCVPPETFRALRDTSGWVETRCDDGLLKLEHEGSEGLMPAEVFIDWGEGYSYADLNDGSFKMNGARFAGLDKVYAWKQDKRRPKDLTDLDLIKNRLFEGLLPQEMTAEELEFINQNVPEHLHGHPALQVAANGLVIVTTLYGRSADGLARRYSGSVEKDIPVFGHTRFHSAGGVERFRRQLKLSNARRAAAGLPSLYNDSDILAIVSAIANHDIIIGDGRGNDENKSGEVVYRHLIQAGCSDGIPEKSRAGVKKTKFDDIKMSQGSGVESAYGVVEDTVQSLDIGSLPEPYSAEESYWMSMEDLSRAKAGFDRILVRQAKKLGVIITDLKTALLVIDSDPEVTAAFEAKLRSCASLHANWRYPDICELDNPEARRAHAAKLTAIADRIAAGELTALDSLEVVREHVAEMASIFSVPDDSHQGYQYQETSSPMDLMAASIGQVATILERAKDQQIPTIINDITERMAAIENRIAQLQANVDEQNSQQLEPQIDLLQKAHYALSGALATLESGGNIARYLDEYIGNLGL